MYFLKGSLPWQGLQVNKGEDRYKKIYQKKKQLQLKIYVKDFLSEFVDYINYTRNLDFEADPDYDYLRGLFASIMEKNSIEYDFYFKWMNEKPNVNEDALVKKYTKKYVKIKKILVIILKMKKNLKKIMGIIIKVQGMIIIIKK